MKTTETTSATRYHPVLAATVAAVCGALIGVALTATAPVPGIASVGEVVSVALPLVRTLLDLAAVGTVGLALLPVLLGSSATEEPELAAPVLARARQGALAGAFIWTVAALVTLLLQTVRFRPGAEGLSLNDIGGYISTVAAGKAVLGVCVLAFVLTVVHVLAMRRGEHVQPWLAVGIGLLALLPLPMTGHASSGALAVVTVASIGLHVLSVAAWVGGLGAILVLLTGNRTLLAQALPRFSKLATVCLACAAATGVLNGLVELAAAPDLGPLAALPATPYGRLVLLKTLCIGVLAALGAHVRWWLLPRIARHERTAVLGWAGLELSVMGIAIGFAAVLSHTPVV